MGNLVKLTEEDLKVFETSQEEAIELIKAYAVKYNSKEHYDILGASCIASATNLINTVTRSTDFLNGKFVMPDQIHVEYLVDWFIENREYNCDRDILLFYMSKYIKRKINKMYRELKNGATPFSLEINGKNTFKEYEKQLKIRLKKGVKMIRVSREK